MAEAARETKPRIRSRARARVRRGLSESHTPQVFGPGVPGLGMALDPTREVSMNTACLCVADRDGGVMSVRCCPRGQHKYEHIQAQAPICQSPTKHTHTRIIFQRHVLSHVTYLSERGLSCSRSGSISEFQNSVYRNFVGLQVPLGLPLH